MMKKDLLKKFLTYFYGSGLGFLIGVITTIISTRLLSPEDFGKASMFTLVTSVLMILIIFGTDQAFVRFFYEEQGTKRRFLLRNTLFIPLCMLIFTVILIFLFKEALMIYLFGENNELVFLAFLIGVVFQVLYRFATLVIRMQQKAKLFSLIEVLNKLCSLILILILYVIIGPSYEILIFSAVIVIIILTSISIIIERKYWSFWESRECKTKHTKKEIFLFSYPLVFTTLITWLFQGFDKIALREWSTFEEIGLYSAAFKIVALLMIVQTTFTTFWTPIVFEKYEKNPEDTEFFSKVSRLIAFSMFVIAIITILLKDVIVILLGETYSDAAVIMPFLVFMPLMYTLSETTVIGINFKKKTKLHIWVAVVACVVNIIGNYLLVPKFGALGAACSTAIAYIIFFMMRTHISLKYYQVNYSLVKVYIMIVLIFLWSLQNIIAPTSLLTYAMGIILLFIVIGIYKSEFQEVLKLLKFKKKG